MRFYFPLLFTTGEAHLHTPSHAIYKEGKERRGKMNVAQDRADLNSDTILI